MAGLTSRTLRSSLSFLLTNTGWMVVLIFELRSVRRLFTALAETWSLNGMITRMGGVVVSVDGMCCWSATLESTNFLTARLNRCFGYLSLVLILVAKFNRSQVREVKPAIVNQQCVVYKFQCNLCDAGYVGYTRGHLLERVDGHKQKSSSICKH